jgi:hypothetical protein
MFWHGFHNSVSYQEINQKFKRKTISVSILSIFSTFCDTFQPFCYHSLFVEALVCLFLTSALDGDKRTSLYHIYFSPVEKAPVTLWIWCWVDRTADSVAGCTRAILGTIETRKFCAPARNQTIVHFFSFLFLPTLKVICTYVQNLL